MPTLGVAIDSRKATIGAEEAKRALSKVRRETNMLDRAQKRLATQMATTGAVAKTSGGMMGTAFAGIGVTMGLTKMVRTIASLDEAMASLQGVTGRTDEQMKILEHTARRLGATTSFTAGQAADGMLMLARAGMSANEVVAATGPVLDLAKVAGVSLEQSSTLLADSLKQFGLQASFAGKAADELVMAANRSNTSIEQLGEGLKLAGPVANAAGMTLSDTAAILGVLADSGLKATLGGTGLRAVLASLAQPSTAAAASLERLGIDTDGLADKIQTRGGLIDVMSRLGPEVMDMTDAIEIFSRRGAAAALILAANTKRWAGLTDQIDEANGTARESAALIEKTLGDSFKTLMSAIDEAILSIGESGFTKALQSMVNFVTEGVRALTSLDTGMTRTGAAAATFIAALAGGAALAALRRLTMALWTIVRGPMAAIRAHPIMVAVTAVTLLVEGFVALASEADFTTQKMKEFNDAIKNITMNTASLVGEYRALDEFMGQKRFFEGRMKIFSSFQKEIRDVIALLKDPSFTEDLPRARFDKLARDLKELNIPVMGSMRAQRSGLPSDNLFVNRQAVIDELVRIHGVLDRKTGEMSSSLKSIDDKTRKATEEAEQAMQPTAPPVDLNQIEQVRAVNEAFAQEIKLLTLEMSEGAKAAEAEARFIQVRNDLIQQFSLPLHYSQEEALRRVIGTMMELEEALDGIAAQKEAIRSYHEVIGQLEEANRRLIETALLGSDVAEQEAEVRRIRNVLEGAGLQLSNDQAERLRELIRLNQKLGEEEDDRIARERNQERFANTMATGLVMPLRDALLSGDFSQVGHQMYMNLVAAMLDEMAIKPLVSALKSVFATAMAADGMALSGGVQRFATGGVVNSPTAFGMAGNRMGIMGEAGPEAIMPLKRLSSGRLGVEAQGGGTTINDNRTINIQVHDDAGFRRTMRQIDRDQARRLNKGTQ